MTDTINFDPDKVRSLRRAYTHAVETAQEQFVFEGKDILVAYAKYLLEYLATKFPKD